MSLQSLNSFVPKPPPHCPAKADLRPQNKRVTVPWSVFGAIVGFRRLLPYLIIFSGLNPIFSSQAVAQENYEIQVYPYDTVEPRHTMVELHSNFTIDGSKTIQDG